MYYGDDYYWGDEGYDEAELGDLASAWPAGQLVQCANGPTCKFFALGTCRFYHPEVEEEAGEEAWDVGFEDGQEPANQETAVFRMVVPRCTGAKTQNQVSMSQPSSQRWNVLVNSQAAATKAVDMTTPRFASRSPRRRKSTSSAESRSPPSATAAVDARSPSQAVAAAPACVLTSSHGVVADTGGQRRRRSHHKPVVLREAPQYLEPPPGIF